MTGLLIIIGCFGIGCCISAALKCLLAASTPNPRTAEMEAIFSARAAAYSAQRKAELGSKTLAQLEVEFSNRAVR